MKPGKFYTMLALGYIQDENDTEYERYITLFHESVKVSFSSNPSQLAVVLLNSIVYQLCKYNASEVSIIRLQYRE